MGDISERLKKGAVVLTELEVKRQAHTLTAEDCDREYIIIADELWDLEEEIVMNPGALAPHVSP